MSCSVTRPVLHSQYTEYLEKLIPKRLEQLENLNIKFHQLQLEYNSYSWFKKLFADNPNSHNWTSRYAYLHDDKWNCQRSLREIRLTLKKVIYSRDIIKESHYMLEDDSKFWETLI